MKAHAIATAVLTLTLTGCGTLIPSQSRKTTATTDTAAARVRNAESFERIVNGSKPEPTPNAPEVRIGGMGNKVEVTVPPPPPPAPAPEYRERFRYDSTADARDESSATLDSLRDISIPAGVKLGLLAGGILALLFALQRVRNASAAVNAAFHTADSVLASQIRRMRERAVVATDSETINALQAQIAELEAERGRMASRRN